MFLTFLTQGYNEGISPVSRYTSIYNEGLYNSDRIGDNSSAEALRINVSMPSGPEALNAQRCEGTLVLIWTVISVCLSVDKLELLVEDF